MMTVKEVSRLAGVSVRTLHHYDAMGLLRPTRVTEAGYRLYDDAALERLQMILLYRELKFPLKDIKVILDSSDFDRSRALEQQIRLLEMQREHIDNLIHFARGICHLGVKYMDFSAFDTSKLDDYAARAKAAWGQSEVYREFEEKSRGRSREAENALGGEMMELMARFGAVRHLPAESGAVQALVEELRGFITGHFYDCKVPILRSLGRMYAGGGEMTENIDAAGGEGTGEFIHRAIQIYCDNRE